MLLHLHWGDRAKTLLRYGRGYSAFFKDAGEWEEHKHPRAKGGQFTSGSGVGPKGEEAKGEKEEAPEKKPELPEPPQIKFKHGLGKQKHLNALHAHAKAGEWEKLSAYPTPGSNTSSKMVQKYKAELMKHAPAAKPAEPEAPAAKAPIPGSFTKAVTMHGLTHVTTSELSGNAMYKDPKSGAFVMLSPPGDPSNPMGTTTWEVWSKAGWPKGESKSGTGMVSMLGAMQAAGVSKQEPEELTPAAQAKAKMPPPSLHNAYVSSIENLGFKFEKPDPKDPEGTGWFTNQETGQQIALQKPMESAKSLSPWTVYSPAAVEGHEAGLKGSGLAALQAALKSPGAHTPVPQAAAPAKPAGAGPVTPPKGMEEVLPGQKPIGNGMVYEKLDAGGYPTEQAVIENSGQWKIWTAEKGTIAQGTGQESLNAAFEGLHPRGPGGKFQAKPGGAPAAAPSKISAVAKNTLEGNGFKFDHANPGGEEVWFGPPGIAVKVAPSQEGVGSAWELFKNGSKVSGGQGVGAIGGAVKTAQGMGGTPGGQTPEGYSSAHTNYLTNTGFQQTAASQPGYFKDPETGVEVYLSQVEKGEDPGGAEWEVYPGKGQDPITGSGSVGLGQAVAKGKVAAKGPKVIPPGQPAHTPPAMQSTLSNASFTPEGYDESLGSDVFKDPDGWSVAVSPPTDPMLPNSTAEWSVYNENGVEVATGKTIGMLKQKLEAAKQGVPTVGEMQPPKGIGQVLPSHHTSSHSTWGGGQLSVYEKLDAHGDPLEQVTIGQNGKWKIWTTAQGTIEQGIGQASLNQAFESLHPRGPGGQFQEKPGGSEGATGGTVKPSSVVEEFSAHKPVPNELNGVPFAPYVSKDWASDPGLNPNIAEDPMKIPAGKHGSAGLLIQEPDGRVWIVEPKGGYGGTQNTFPKGTIDPGETPQQAALREAWEESGLHGEITGLAGDYLGQTSLTRYYFAKRIGGTPAGYGSETQGVRLVPPAELAKFLNQQRDLDIAKQHYPPPPPKAKIGQPIDHKKLKQVGPQLGSNPGFQGEDEAGNRYYVKHSMNPERAQSELLAAALYNAAGSPTLDYHPLENGTGVATDWQDPDKKGGVKAMTAAERKAARANFATHAWLANWDAAGLGGDNQQTIGGVPTTVDVGGSLNYRAQGGLKGNDFGNEVNEWDTLRDKAKNPDAAGLFGDMTPEELQASAAKVGKISDSMIRNLVDQHGPGTTKEKAALAQQLIQRRDDLVKRATPPKPMGAHELRKHIAAWNPPGKPQEAVSEYKGNTYKPMNAMLRFFDNKQIASDTTKAGQYIREITDWMNKASSKEDVTLYRGIPKDVADQIKMVAKPGMIVDDEAFQSMSTSKQFADSWHGGPGLTYKIFAPKGSKMATVRPASQEDGEYEVLSQRRSKLLITKWDQATKTYEVTLMPPDSLE